MQGFMIMLLTCSVSMSALTLFYMAATPLFAKRYSAMGRYYTWLILVSGLIIPFRPQFSNAIVKVNMPHNPTVPVIHMGSAPVTSPIQNAALSSFTNISFWQIAAAVWLAGTILFLTYHAVKHYHFLKLTARWSETITDEQTLTLLENLKEQMGLSKKIGLRTCASIGSPMLIGFARPCILLPKAVFAADELCFILKHELVHYKRKDLWYKCLVLMATAIHWFNPIVYLMAKAIDVQCELSCDAEVVRSTSAGTRLNYSETIIGVIRYQSKLKTALSTHFYGGKKGMKTRIFSIMDMSKKKAGLSIVCGALILTLGTGAAFAANAEREKPPENTKSSTEITPWIAASFLPNPDIYAKYADFGIAISNDGTQLLYKGQPVRLFVDEKSDAEAFYLNDAGNMNLSVIRNPSGEMTGIERLTTQKAQEYQDAFFAEERSDSSFANARDRVEVQETVQAGPNKFAQYRPFGITCTDEVLYFHGQRVKFLIDQSADEGAAVLWEDDAGTANLAVTRNASGQIMGVERISDENAREYRSASEESAQKALEGLEERVEARMTKLYSN